MNHQVEQLERSVQGAGSGNWRDRRGPQMHSGPPLATQGVRRGPNPPGVKVPARKKRGEIQIAATKERVPVEITPTPKRRSVEEDRKDADIVVVDASVLVHALYKVKKWCKEGREEVIIIPLEGTLQWNDRLKLTNMEHSSEHLRLPQER